jgi:hypothetical protein
MVSDQEIHDKFFFFFKEKNILKRLNQVLDLGVKLPSFSLISLDSTLSILPQDKAKNNINTIGNA